MIVIRLCKLIELRFPQIGRGREWEKGRVREGQKKKNDMTK